MRFRNPSPSTDRAMSMNKLNTNFREISNDDNDDFMQFDDNNVNSEERNQENRKAGSPSSSLTRQTMLKEISKYEFYHFYLNSIVFMISFTLFFVSLTVSLLFSFFLCSILSSSLSLFFCSLTYWKDAVYSIYGKWIYLILTILVSFVFFSSLVIEGIVCLSYCNCEKGYNCQLFQQYSYYWPYLLSMSLIAIALLFQLFSSYCYSMILSSFALLNDESMVIDSSSISREEQEKNQEELRRKGRGRNDNSHSYSNVATMEIDNHS
jgi:hypothetical protein